MRTHHTFGLLYAFTHVTNALCAGKYCPLACETSINYVTFNDTDSWLSRKVRQCRSEFRVTSLYLCFDEYCKDDEETEAWLGDQTSWCEEHAGVTLPTFRDVMDRWTPDGKAEVRRLHADQALSFPSLNEIVIPDGRFFQRAFSTLVGLPAVRLHSATKC
jgi:hypothetical protein